MSQIDWITEKSFGKYAKNAAQEELNSFYGIAKSMRDSGMDNEIIAENLKTMYGATPEQVERVQKEVLGKTADVHPHAQEYEVTEITNFKRFPDERDSGEYTSTYFGRHFKESVENLYGVHLDDLEYDEVNVYNIPLGNYANPNVRIDKVKVKRVVDPSVRRYTADTGDMFTKAEVNYRKAPQCVRCLFFINSGEGQPKTCEIVEGYIKMPDVCDKFEAK